MDLRNVYISILWNLLYSSVEEYNEFSNNFEISFDLEDLDKVSNEDLAHASEYLNKLDSKVIIHAPFIGLSFGNVSWCDLEQSRNYLKRFLEIGSLLGTGAYIFHLLLPKTGSNFDTWLKESIETIEIINSAAGNDKVFCFENVFENKIEVFEDIFNVFKEKFKFIKRCFDFGHSNIMYGPAATYNWLESLDIFEVFHIHLHDNNGKLDEHLPLGTGNIDFKRILKYFQEKSSRPGITIENFDKKGLTISFNYLHNKL